MLGLALAALLVGVAVAWRLGRGIAQPLNEAIYIAETVAAGDLSQEFATERGGDFGRLLGALGDMEDTLTDLVSRIKASTDSITLAVRRHRRRQRRPVAAAPKSRPPRSKKPSPAWKS